VKHDSIELSHFILVYGEYGSGKTHALKYLRSALGKSDHVLATYIVKPKVEKKGSFHGIVKEVIMQIGERPLRNAAEPFVKYVQEESNRLALEGLNLAGIEGSLDQHVKRRSAEFKRSLQEQIYPPFPELLELFEGVTREDPAAWQYFTGKPSATSLSHYGLTAPMDDDHDALKALAGLYQVLTTRYDQIPNTPVFDAAYLFIDELEQLLEIKTDEVLSIRTGIRDIFNACTQHFCLILAATAENVSFFHGLLEEALMVRITAEPIHIVSHDSLDDGAEFIRELMENYRSSPPPTPFHPFTEQALRRLVDRTSLPRTARKLIFNCRRVWEQNADVVLDGGDIGEDEIEAAVGLL
jgi:hypothetical protein